MPEQLAILLTLVVYLALLVGVGIWAGRRTHDGDDFILAGRRMGPWVASLSASASSSSAWTLLGVSGFAYERGLSAIWLFPACVGGFALNWFVLAPALREHSHATGALTLTEVLADSGTPAARRAIRRLASAIVLLALVTYVASQFQGAGKTLAETFALTPAAAVLVGAAIVVFYTLLGGFWAVSVTDSIQGFAMLLTAAVLPVGALAAVGPARVLDGLSAVPVAGYADPFAGMAPAAALGFVAGLLGIGLGYPGQPHVVNRFMALRRGAAELRTARAASMVWAVVVYAGMIALGLTARVGLPPADDAEGAMLFVAAELFPPVVAGCMIAAVLSAVMSTADSQLLVAASTVSHDLVERPDARATLLARSRWTVLALSALAVVAALAVEETIFSRVLFAWSAMGAAFGPLVLVRVLRGPVTAPATLGAMGAGFALSVAAYVARQVGWLGGEAGMFERVLPFVVALAIAWIGSRPGRPEA